MVVHVILDNDAAQQTADVPRWLARHPRWSFHVTPTSSFPRPHPDARRVRGWIDRFADDRWRNAVEGFVATLSRRRLKHGVVRSVVDLQAAINRFVEGHNENPQPFVWRAEPDAIIAARANGFQAVRSDH